MINEEGELPKANQALMADAVGTSVGALLGDGFVKYPNMVGMGLSAFQLSLFRIYPAKKVKKTASMENMI